MSALIFHITSRSEWDAAQKAGQYVSPSLAKEGFIHCSTLAQVLPVAEKFYRGQSGLILLGIDPSRLSSAVKWEPPFEGAPPPGVPADVVFPHIHGPLDLNAVVQVLDLVSAPDGSFVLPSSL
jgi:uncharacterized protein (DUF952 family)